MKSARAGAVIGVASSLLLAGCTGGSPMSPTIIEGVPASSAPQIAGQAGPITAGAAVKKQEVRFVECELPDGSFSQLSVSFYGVPGAVHHCLKVLEGKSDGKVKAPAPSFD